MKKRFLLFLCYCLLLLSLLTFSDDDEDVEAVVVTGSYIKTDREDQIYQLMSLIEENTHPRVLLI